MKIGLIGLGRMGQALSTRFGAQGIDTIGWDRDPEAASRVKSNRFSSAGSPAEIVAAVDAVITCISEDNGVRQVYFGPNGLLSGDVTGKLLMEMSTLQPDTEKELAAAVAAKGATFVETPVLGSIPTVLDGKLRVLAGGSEADVARARDILKHIARDVVHMGAVGSGSAMKLGVNLAMAAYLQVVTEILAMGANHGLGLKQMTDILAECPTSNAWLIGKIPVLLGQKADITLDIKTMRKDVMSAVAAGTTKGVPMPLASGALSSLSAAVAAGLGDEDLAELAKFYRDNVVQNFG
jgi:3-hydroxyisobutyrate dehydrogenase-like beta-hydroxyacid dehydrogenase